MLQIRSLSGGRARYDGAMRCSDFLLPVPETMFQECSDRNAAFEGNFWVGVRFTGLFCRPTCPERKPVPGNVEFFHRAGDALAAGYRPCRRCAPMEAVREFPDWLKPLMDAVDADPLRRWTAEELRHFGVESARARRWFQAFHGMTLVAYLRARRLGQAFSRICDGAETIDASMDADFDSVGDFCDAIPPLESGHFPAPARQARKTVHVSQMMSPLGPILIAGDDEAVYLIEFWDRRLLQTQFAVLKARLGAVFLPGLTPVVQDMERELSEYFAGKRAVFEVPFRCPGTAHQQAVWHALAQVPAGESWSYGKVAARIGKPRAGRAVARAIGENRLAIVIPCHRIVGADGHWTGYGGGVWRKRALLALERGEWMERGKWP